MIDSWAENNNIKLLATARKPMPQCRPQQNEISPNNTELNCCGGI